jgi:ATP-dependent Lon protease
LPAANAPEWEEVPTEVRSKLKVHFIRHISELLPLALRDR